MLPNARGTGQWYNAFMSGKQFVQKARAKINLHLEVASRRDDGYHDIRTVYQSIALADIVTIERADFLKVTCDNPAVPDGPENSAFKAAQLICSRFHAMPGFHIHIKKNIPLCSGMGGESTDAAAVLRGLNYMLDLGLDRGQLERLGSEIGCDVPFCIRGGTAVGTMRGDKLIPVPANPGHELVICMPDHGVKTGDIYDKIALTSSDGRFNQIVTLLVKGVFDQAVVLCQNAFEPEVGKQIREVGQYRELLKREGSWHTAMTGSGSAIFGFFNDRASAGNAVAKLQGSVAGIFHTVTDGPAPGEEKDA